METLRLFARNKLGLVGLVLVGLLVLSAVIGPGLRPVGDTADLAHASEGPTAEHPLGTNFQGLDNLALLFSGGKDIMLIALITGILETLIAVSIGATAAYFGGRADALLVAFIELWLTIPRFPLLAILATLLKLKEPWMLSIIIAVMGWPSLARQVRTVVLSLKKRDYIEAANMLDLGPGHIIFREMLPNMLSFIAIALVSTIVFAIYYQTSLVFLGLIPFSSANWGVMLSLAENKGAIYTASAAWGVITPIGAIVMLQIGLVWIMRALEEVFNPRLRQGV
ncbi:MAG: ABC transporter permease [Thermoflexales bacterium]|nr:ABC transporter permease [Thermoflexales bacterium]